MIPFVAALVAALASAAVARAADEHPLLIHLFSPFPYKAMPGH